VRDDAVALDDRTTANLMQQVYRNTTKTMQFGNVQFVLEPLGLTSPSEGAARWV